MINIMSISTDNLRGQESFLWVVVNDIGLPRSPAWPRILNPPVSAFCVLRLCALKIQLFFNLNFSARIEGWASRMKGKYVPATEI